MRKSKKSKKEEQWHVVNEACQDILSFLSLEAEEHGSHVEIAILCMVFVVALRRFDNKTKNQMLGILKGALERDPAGFFVEEELMKKEQI